PIYPYPPIYYPYYPPGAAFITFTYGFAMGAWMSGGWGYGCGWGGSTVYINHHNTFVGGAGGVGGVGGAGGVGGPGASQPKAGGAGGRSDWQHKPEHRGGAPYADRATADRFGGSARGDSFASRQATAQQRLARQGGNVGAGGGA